VFICRSAATKQSIGLDRDARVPLARDDNQARKTCGLRSSAKFSGVPKKVLLSRGPIRNVGGLSEITVILQQIDAGDAEAANRILPLVYDELRKLAAAKMARESASQTLQPTALVHEAWLRLGGEAQPSWKNRAHFFAAAAEAMRRILIENARRRHRCATEVGWKS
jgi:hypothetical protein